MALRSIRKRSKYHRGLAALGLCAFFCTPEGCYEQPVTEREVIGALPDAEIGTTYEVDIYLLSELAGRFLAQGKSGSTVVCGKFEKEIDGCFLPTELIYSSPTRSAEEPEKPGEWEPADGNGKISSDSFVYVSDGETAGLSDGKIAVRLTDKTTCEFEMTFYPYGDRSDSLMQTDYPIILKVQTRKAKSEDGGSSGDGGSTGDGGNADEDPDAENDIDEINDDDPGDADANSSLDTALKEPSGWIASQASCRKGDAVCSNEANGVWGKDDSVCDRDNEECVYQPYWNYINANGYTCYASGSYNYNVSGMDNIYRVWDKYYGMKSDGKSIRVGNGDSYGVSIPQSSAFNDVPTIRMLNLIDFTYETFGNHSFDNNLDYMKSAIAEADYSYVSSNMSYLAQNLGKIAEASDKGVRQYATVSIPPKEGSGNDLILAVFGVTDRAVTRSVFPGRFGTIDFGKDYCPLIQAMERAYNRNARAFLVLAHVYTERGFSDKFLNELFLLTHDDAGEDGDPITTDTTGWDASDLHNMRFYDHIKTIATHCPSRLILDDKEIERSHAQYEAKGVTLTRSELKSRLIAEKRQEIFNGLIGVYGDASDEPILYAYRDTHDKQGITEQDGETGSGTGRDKQTYTNFYDQGEGASLSANKFESKPAGITGLKYAHYDGTKETVSDETGAKNVLHYFRIPKNGEYTGKLTAVVTPKCKSGEQECQSCKGDGGSEACTYIASIKSFDVRPSIGESFDDATPTVCNEIGETWVNCGCFFDEAKRGSGILNEEIADEAAFSEAENDVGAGAPIAVGSEEAICSGSCKTSDLVTEEKYSQCYKDMKNNIIDSAGGDAANTIYDDIYQEQLRWACAYNITSKKVCKDDYDNYEESAGGEKSLDWPKCEDAGGGAKDAYYSPTIQSFGEGMIAAESKSELRNKTTVAGNILTLAVSDFLNGDAARNDGTSGWQHFYDQVSAEKQDSLQTPSYDVLYFNAGGIVAATSGYSSIDMDWVLEHLPYGNTVKVIENGTADLLVSMIEHGLSQGAGAFPMISGAVFSYETATIDGKEGKRVCDIWKTKESFYGGEYEFGLDALYYYDENCGAHIAKVQFGGGAGSESTYESECFGSGKQTLASAKSSDGIYKTAKAIKILVPDYLATGGDGYGSVLTTENKSYRGATITSPSGALTTDQIVLSYYRNSSMKTKETGKTSEYAPLFAQAACRNRMFFKGKANLCVSNTFCSEQVSECKTETSCLTAN